MSQEKQVVYAFFGTYPDGPAASRRIQLVCRGLQAAGVMCTVLALSGDPKATESSVSKDRYGIRVFRLPHPLSGGKLLEKLRKMHNSPCLFAKAFKKIAEEGNIQGLVLYNDLSRVFLPICQVAKSMGIKVLADCTEQHNFHLPWLVKYHFWDQALYRGQLLRSVDGIIGISRYWAPVAEKLQKSFIRIPALADTEEPDWPPPVRCEGHPFLLSYIGALAERDVPRAMLQAISDVAREGLVDIRLQIIGGIPNQSATKDLMRRVKANKLLRDRVLLLGSFPREALHNVCMPTHAYLFLREQTRDVNACFPTRLPEQLLSRRPMIASAVGDFPLYLRHRQNALLISPGTEMSAVPEAIRSLATNHKLLLELGASGRRTALSELGFEQHGSCLARFLSKISDSGNK